MAFSNDTEILKLRPNVRNRLAAMLDDAVDSWKDLAEVIPKKQDLGVALYSADEIWYL